MAANGINKPNFISFWEKNSESKSIYELFFFFVWVLFRIYKCNTKQIKFWSLFFMFYFSVLFSESILIKFLLISLFSVAASRRLSRYLSIFFYKIRCFWTLFQNSEKLLNQCELLIGSFSSLDIGVMWSSLSHGDFNPKKRLV